MDNFLDGAVHDVMKSDIPEEGESDYDTYDYRGPFVHAIGEEGLSALEKFPDLEHIINAHGLRHYLEPVPHRLREVPARVGDLAEPLQKLYYKAVQLGLDPVKALEKTRSWQGGHTFLDTEIDYLEKGERLHPILHSLSMNAPKVLEDVHLHHLKQRLAEELREAKTPADQIKSQYSKMRKSITNALREYHSAHK